MNNRHYFDWAATAIPDAGIRVDAPFGNPSSKYEEGRLARQSLEDARKRCATVLGLEPSRLYFTSGGTESNALVLFSLLMRKNRTGMSGLLYSTVEHPSIRENTAPLEQLGIPAVPVGVEPDGRVSPRALERALEKRPRPLMAAFMAVNNETGSLSDLGVLTRLLRSQTGPRIHVHSDMVQAAGKIPVDIPGWDLDSASFSAHKLGGPRGIGLLYLRKAPDPVYRGGGQEGGIRPGTENTAGALALAECLERHARPELVNAAHAEATERMAFLIRALKTLNRCTILPRDREDRDPRFSPYILQAAFQGIPGEVMVRTLDDAGFAVSTGSACSSSSKSRPVLTAMGVEGERAFEGIRISQGWSTTTADIEALVREIGEILRVL
ncbi:MAG: aminotransferase class V-fold PLP-dependent enzyme [Spirochaetaceae bacterium]|jgi:cysteine desulfurase|nr:aminotransferase class V-fold PLP-dependent enzyme [Spirochaetaceae bacterium]